MKKQFGTLLVLLLIAVGCGETPQVDQAAQPVLNAPQTTPGATAGLPSSAEPSTSKTSAPPTEDSTDVPDATTPGGTAGLPSSADASKPDASTTDATVAVASSGPAIRIGGEENQPVIEVANLSDEELKAIEQLDASQRKERLQVFVAEFEGVPALDGEVAVVDGKLRFTPRFPLEQGVRYD